jgi:hypothetical protein
MTSTQARIRDHVVNAAITMIATLFLTFGTGLWQSKESVAAHATDMQRVNTKLERILDVLCQSEANARARACTGSAEVVP